MLLGALTYVKRILLFLFSRVYATNVTSQVATKSFFIWLWRPKPFNCVDRGPGSPVLPWIFPALGGGHKLCCPVGSSYMCLTSVCMVTTLYHLPPATVPLEPFFWQGPGHQWTAAALMVLSWLDYYELPLVPNKVKSWGTGGYDFYIS